MLKIGGHAVLLCNPELSPAGFRAAYESLLSCATLHFFSTHGTRSFWEVSLKSPCYLVFGSESRGFPPSFYERYKEQLVRIPVESAIRSLNLATAVGAAAFEAARQFNVAHRL